MKIGLEKYNKRMGEVAVKNQDIIPFGCNLYSKEVSEKNFRNSVRVMFADVPTHI
jgi:hypothetical protein